MIFEFIFLTLLLNENTNIKYSVLGKQTSLVCASPEDNPTDLPSCKPSDVSYMLIPYCLDSHQHWGTYSDTVVQANGQGDYSVTCAPPGCEQVFIGLDAVTMVNSSYPGCTCTPVFLQTLVDQYGGLVTSCRNILIHAEIINSFGPSKYLFDANVDPLRDSTGATPILSVNKRRAVDYTLEGPNIPNDVFTGTCHVYAQVVYTETWTNLLIQVQNVGTTSWVALIRKWDFSTTAMCTGLSCTVPLPNSATVTTGQIYIDIVVGNTVCGEDQETIVGTKLCRSSDCMLCSNAFVHFSCLEPTEQFFLIFGIVIVGLLTLLLLPVAWIFLVFITCGTLKLPIWFGRALMRFYHSRFMRDMKKKVDSTKEYVMTEDKPAANPGGNRLALGLVLVSLLKFTGAVELPRFVGPCATSATIPAVYEVCNNYGTYENCSLDTTIITSIPYPGVSACITLTQATLDETGVVPVAYVEIHYTYAVDSVNLVTQYFTSAWSVDGCTQSNSKCSGTDCDNEKCSHYQSHIDPLNGNSNRCSNYCVATHPHEWGCSNGCSDNVISGCGCGINYNPRCNYWCYGIWTKPQFAQVYLMNQRVLAPKVQITITDMLGNVFTAGLLFSTNSVTLNGITVQIIGSLAGTLSTFPFNNVITYIDSPENTFMGPASIAGTPTMNLVGDIQANSRSTIETPPSTSVGFIYDRGLVQPTNQARGTDFTVATPGIYNIERLLGTTYTRFPQMIGPDIWSFDMSNSIIWALASAPGALQVGVSTAGEYIISTSVAVVCPAVELITVTGCFDCLPGSVVTITALSTCAAGPVLISADVGYVQLGTSSLVFGLTSQEFMIYFSTSVQDNNFDIVFSAGGLSTSIHITYTAVRLEINLENNVTHISHCAEGVCDDKGGIGGKDVGKDISNWFGDIFAGRGTWWWDVVMAIVLFVGLVLFLYLSKFLLNTFSAKSAQARMMNNYMPNPYTPPSAQAGSANKAIKLI